MFQLRTPTLFNGLNVSENVFSIQRSGYRFCKSIRPPFNLPPFSHIRTTNVKVFIGFCLFEKSAHVMWNEKGTWFKKKQTKKCGMHF